MSILRSLSTAFEDMVVGIEGSFSDMASMMIDPFQKLLRQSEDQDHGGQSGHEQESQHDENVG